MRKLGLFFLSVLSACGGEYTAREAAATAIVLPIEERTRDGKELRWKVDRYLRRRGGGVSVSS